jgi:hypothetical protein
MFYGVLIRMFFFDTDKHKLPHIHAEFQGSVAVYSIPDGELLAGRRPTKKRKMVLSVAQVLSRLRAGFCQEYQMLSINKS